ncbi:MAG: hypothetical protein F6K19_19815, partial [Cyanothece sp. SIO1E1]|nr:hypothetical protein [Cyanothece sp. SIO1E1]
IERLETHYQERGDTIFCGNPAWQITPEYYYSGGGEIIPVKDLESARAALTLIIEQGEGDGGSIEDEDGEIPHYFRFQQLKLGQYYQKGDMPNHPSGQAFTVDWDDVYPIKTNAKLTDYPPGSEVYEVAQAFNTFYDNFLKQLEVAFSGHPEVLMPAVGTMFTAKEKINALMRNPIPGNNQLNAAPTFEVNLAES